MAPALIGYLIANAALWGLSYYLRDDEEDLDDKEYDKPSGRMTQASPGDIVPIVFGRCLVNTHPIFFANEIGSAAGIFEVPISAQLSVCLIPNTTADVEDFAFGHIYIGGKRVRGVAKLENFPTYTLRVDDKNFFGGEDKGGGIGRGNSRWSANNNIFYYGYGLIHLIRGNDFSDLGQFNSADANAARAMLALLITSGQTTNDDILNGIGGNPNLASIIIERFVLGESQGREWGKNIPSVAIEAICIPTYPGMIPDVTGYVVTDPDYGPWRSPGGVLLGTALMDEVVRGDANPASVLYCVLTDDVVGASLSTGDIDFPSFVAAAAILSAEGNGISLMLTETASLREIIKIILTQIDGVLYSDPETQMLKLGLARQDYGTFPYPTLFVADESNCAQVTEYRTGNWEDTYNQVRVEFYNRAKDYQLDEVVTQDLSGGQKLGRTRDITFRYDGVKTATLASALAARDLKGVAIPTLSVTLEMNRTAGHLAPGSVFLWNWSKYNVVGMVLRVIQIDRGVLESGKITLQCVQEKHAVVAPVFVDPQDGGIFVPPVADFPFDVGVWEPPNTGGLGGGFSTWGDASEGRMAIAVAAGQNHNYSFLEVSTDFGFSYNRISSELASTPHAVLGEQLSIGPGDERYYDVTTGMLIFNPSEDVNLGPFTSAQIRNGDNLLLVGDETISFESSTDLGQGYYRLNNIWRGLLDSDPAIHVRGESVFFLTSVDQQRTISNIHPGVEGQIKFRLRANSGRELQHEGDATYLTANFTKRAKKPPVPTGLAIITAGSDDTSPLGDVEYAFDVTDPLAVDIQVSTGTLSETLGDYGKVFTNDVMAAWSRRLMVPTSIVRGDEADIAPTNRDVATYRLEGRTDQADWEILQETTFDGVGTMTHSQEFSSLALQGLGKGEIRLCSVHEDSETGELLCATDGNSIKVDMIGPRELLENGKFRPAWNIAGDSGGAAFGRGKKVVGNGSTFARGWTTLGDVAPVFGVHARPFEQGDGSAGHAFWPATTGGYALVQQVVALPWDAGNTLNGSNAVATLKFMHFRDDLSGLDNKYSCLMETYSESGTLLDSASVSDATIATDADGWVEITHTLTMSTTGAASIKITLGLESDTLAVIPSAIGHARLMVTPDYVGSYISPIFVTGGSLASYGFTTTGTWTTQETLGGVDKIQWFKVSDTIKSVFPHCVTPASGEAHALFTETLADDVAPGDIVRASVWVCRTEVGAADNTVELSITSRTAGAAAITTKTTGAKTVAVVDRWMKLEVWARIPEQCDSLDWDLDFIVNSGSNIDMGWDFPVLEIFKAGVRKTTLSYGTPAVQPVLSSAKIFSDACATPEAKPYAIFLFDDAPGAPAQDKIRQQTFDLTLGTEGSDFTRAAPSPGVWDGFSYVQTALELSRVAGGISTSDTAFMDPKNNSIGVYIEFKMREFGHSGISNIISKINANPTPVNGAGFQIYHDATTDRIYFYVASNFTAGNEVSASVYLQLPTEMDAGAHWAYFKFDKTTALLSCFSDLGEGTAADLNDFVVEEFSNPIDQVFLGANDQIGGSFDEGFKAPFHLRVLAFLQGAPSEKFTPSSGQALWVHGSDPNTGFALTATRASDISLPVSGNEVATFSGSDIVSEVPLLISYWSALTANNQLALSSPMPTQNLIPYSEDFGHVSWTKVDMVADPMSARSPRGYLEATRLEQSAVGGYVEKLISGLTAGDEITASLYLSNDKTIFSATVVLLEDDLSTVITSSTFTLTEAPQRFFLTGAVAAGQTSIGVRIYGSDAVSDDACIIFGLQAYLHQNGGGEPVVPNFDATLNTSPLVTHARLGMDPNSLGTADEGGMNAVIAAPRRLTGGITRNVLRLSGDTLDDERLLTLVDIGGEANEAYYTFDVRDGVGAAQISIDHGDQTDQLSESLPLLQWKSELEIRNNGTNNATLDHNGYGTQEALAFFASAEGLVDLHVGCGPSGDSLDGGVQSVDIFNNGPIPEVTPAAPSAVRIYPETQDEYRSRFTSPLVTAIFPLQRKDSLQPDVVGRNHFLPIDGPTFGVTADTRLGVLMGNTLARVEIPDATKLSPDGFRDMTYLCRVFLSGYPVSGAAAAIFSKRGGPNFPGFSLYMDPGGDISCAQDGGGVGMGRSDIHLIGTNHQGAYADLAYVLDRTGLNEGRIESSLGGTATATLVGVDPLISTTGLALGRGAYEGRGALVGSIFTYFAVAEDVAMTRPELEEFWATQIP